MKKKRDWGTFLHGLAGTAIGAAAVAGLGDAGFASAAAGAGFGLRREKRQHPGEKLTRHRVREGLAWGFGALLGGALVRVL